MPAATQEQTSLPSLKILPINSSADSKGSIHDDEKAREMGYRGGLVGGSTILAYMSRLMRQHYGDAWLAGATLSGRLRRPVYEGAEVTVEGTIVEGPSASNGGRVTVELRVVNPEGDVAAVGQATCLVGVTS